MRLKWRPVFPEIGLKAVKAVCIGFLALAVSTPIFVGTSSEAAGDTRSLKIYYVHTGEKAVITYKRNGKFDPRGLEQLNRILRDWRKNEPTKMDPRLFDLIWEVYRDSGSHEFINVICGFRSPGTNEMLRTRSAHTGVAKKSQHMLGKAMDFYLPDVKLAKLREIGMKMQVGGVGYYPTSGSPFVHMDVGGVRAWPRMDRQDLVRLFPDGKTMHIPADGKPLPGYEEAVADYKKRMSSEDIQIASAGGGTKHRGFFARLFGGGADEEEDTADSDSSTPSKVAPVAVAKQTAPAADADSDDAAPSAPEANVAVASVSAPVPLARPAFAGQQDGTMMAALVSPNRSNAAQDALAAAMPQQQQSQYVDLRAYSVPAPSLLDSRRAGTETASLDSGNVMSDVPVPLERPAVAEKLLASASADPDAQDDQADANTLSPAVVVALTQQRPNIGTQASTAVEALNAVSPQFKMQPKLQPPVQMAALAPSRNGNHFGDAFDAPKPMAANESVAIGIPAKGGRPTKQEADTATAGHGAIRTEPKLTDKIISQWALTNARMQNVAKPVKAPRFVSPTLRAQPTAVYSAGFTTNTASIDTNRFSGSAVNFMQVKKFNSIQ